MPNLITAAEFAALRNISKKIDTDKVDEAVELAENSDLNDILGDFFFDVVKNQAAENYADLMAGAEFTYEGENYIHKGIKALLADYTYARFIYMINVSLTPFGAVTKFSQDSQGVDRNTIKDLSKQAQVDASIKFRTIEKYILSKPEIFSRYCKNKSGNTGFNSLRVSKL